MKQTVVLIPAYKPDRNLITTLQKLSEEDSKPVEVLKSAAETDAESDGRS